MSGILLSLSGLQIPLRKGEGHGHLGQVQEQIATEHEEVPPNRLQFHPQARVWGKHLLQTSEALECVHLAGVLIR